MGYRGCYCLVTEGCWDRGFAVWIYFERINAVLISVIEAWLVLSEECYLWTRGFFNFFISVFLLQSWQSDGEDEDVCDDENDDC